ncbi:MAG: patatin-like phospholipase family protein [Candidatus Azobacteroides sp.]|nr:patatin-like phospholipase family protein [Candidatus Azobacteroides sp.]
MSKKRIILLLCLLFCFLSVYPQKVGLVLSGGGAKGAVHLGIIKALEENNIPIDYISGTSIGAVIGSLYAMGYTPDEILDLFLSEDFNYWQTGKVQERYQYFFRKNPNQPDFVKFNVPLNDSLSIKTTDLLPNSLINPIQMNQAFLQLFSQANAQCRGNFNNLFVPFLCVASDVFNKQMIVFRNGDLSSAVRASMTFPLVFKPILKDSIPLFDGGIYDNFPVGPMKEAFHPDFIIGSSVAGNKMKKPSDMDLYKLVESVIMQKTSYHIDPKEGIMLNFTLDDVGLLDFNKSKALYDMGYKAALEIMDSIKGEIKRRVSLDDLTKRRAFYKKALPPLVFRDIYISGVNDVQREYIEHQINKNDNQTNFTIDDFKRTYFRLLSNPKIQEIYPRAVWDSIDNSFDLYLDIQTRNEIAVAFGGNISSMSANQLYLGVGYRSLTDFFSEINLDMQVGNTYNGIVLSGKIEVPSSTLPLDISGTIAYNYRKYYESERLFIDTDVATFIHQRETYGKLGIGFPFQNKARMDVFMGYGFLEDKYYKNNTGPYYENDFDRSAYNLFSTGVLYSKNTQGAKQYPVQGQNHHIYAQYISGNENFFPAQSKSKISHDQSWIQLDAFLYNIHAVNSKFNFGYMAEGVVSSKNLLSNYTASILQAPAYTPTPFSKIVFNEAFRANQFLAGGIIPIWKLNSTFHLRGDFHGFLPVYPIRRGDNDEAYYSHLFTHPAYLGEVSLVAQLPFMSISVFTNYYSYPKNNWNLGLNIGYLIFGSKFITQNQ